MNLSYLCIDKHINDGFGEENAIIYDSPVTNSKEKITYNKLYQEVSKLAGGLKKIGLQFLKQDFDRARNIRNSRVHKDRHTFMGLVGYPINNIKLFINLINQIFQNKSDIEILITQNNLLSKTLLHFKNNPMILQFNDKRIQISNIILFKYIKYHTKELLILLVEPVLTNTFNLLQQNPSRNPLLLTFRNFTINKEQLIGLDQKGDKISIEFTNKKENRIVYDKFLKDKSKLSDINKTVYDLGIIGNAPWEMEKIMYDNCWYKYK